MCVFQFGLLLRIAQRLDERLEQPHVNAAPRDQRFHFLPAASLKQLQQLNVDRPIGYQRAFDHRRPVSLFARM